MAQTEWILAWMTKSEWLMTEPTKTGWLMAEVTPNWVINGRSDPKLSDEWEEWPKTSD